MNDEEFSDRMHAQEHSGVTDHHVETYHENNQASTDASLNAAARSKRKQIAGKKMIKKRWFFVAALAAVVSMGALIATHSMMPSTQQYSATTTGSQTITIGLKLAPTNLDIRNQSGSALEQLLIGNVYEGLVARDNNNHVVPGLAQRWDISKDGLHYTFHLRKGALFSNGHALTAHDAAWSLQELIDKQYHDFMLLGSVTSIQAKDDTTLTVTLAKPNAQLLWALSARPGLVFDSRAKFDMKTQAIGSGPYLVERFIPADRVVLVANTQYRGIHPAKTKRIVVRYFVDDNAAVDAIRSGSVQALSPISAQLAEPFKRDSRYIVRAGNGTDKFVLAMNMKGERTKDIRVRQAIRYAIDHRQIIASRGGSDLALGGPIPLLDPGYEDLTKLYPHDLKRAKQLMNQAGFSQQHPLSLTLTYANVYGAQLGDQLRSQLKPVGIDLKVRIVEFSTWLHDVYTNHHYDLSLVDHNESHDFAQWANPAYYYGYDNGNVQALYKKAMETTDEHTMNKYLAQAARLVSQDAPADWLFNYRIVRVAQRNLQGLPLDLTQAFLPLYNLQYAK